MQKKTKRKLKYVIISFGIVGICIVSYLLMMNFADPGLYLSSDVISSENGKSSYDPSSVLLQMQNNEIGIFSDIESEEDNEFQNNYVFSDDELYLISRYFIKEKWNDNPEDWRLVIVYYTVDDCTAGLNGQVSVSFFYEKLVTIEGVQYVNEREIGIDTWKNEIVWKDEIITRTTLLENLNWEEIKYNATDVFEISKKNGGEKVLEESANRCEQIMLALYGNNNKWNVDYYDNNGSNILELEINKRTGQVNR